MDDRGVLLINCVLKQDISSFVGQLLMSQSGYDLRACVIVARSRRSRSPVSNRKIEVSTRLIKHLKYNRYLRSLMVS